MIETRHDDLKYGHVGECTYNPVTKSWIWKRTLERAPSFQLLGSPYLAISSPSLIEGPHKAQEPSIGLAPAARHAEQVGKLLRSAPQLAPGTHLLGADVKLSEEVEVVVARHDPNVGNCLAMGSIPDHTTQRRVLVAAFPGNQSTTLLRFVQALPQRQGWHQNKTIWLDVPRVHGESGSWNAKAPIQQVCYAHSSEGAIGGLLAIRTLADTCILRPVLRRHTQTSDAFAGKPSRFDANLICTVPLEYSGGVSHADVAFNPWYPNQIALVDQQGTWQVWDTIGLSRVNENGDTPAPVAQGAISDRVLDDAQSRGQLLDDGWGRVIWAGDVKTIVVCSRREVGVYDISSKPVRLLSPEVGVAGTSHWILDMRSGSVESNRHFVLTSTHLLCLTIKPLDEEDFESYHSAGAVVLLKLRHYRDVEDVSLQLDVIADQEAINVLLRSSVTGVVTSHHFTTNQTTSAVSDASLVRLPTIADGDESVRNIIGLDIHIIDYVESLHHTKASGPGMAYKQRGVGFLQVTLLLKDLSIVQQLYCSSTDSHETAPSRRVLAPQWQSRINQSISRWTRDSFVVADDLDDSDEEDERPVSRQLASLGLGSHVHHQGQRSINFEILYTEIARSSTDETRDFSAVVSSVKDFFDHVEEPGNQCLRLLSTFANPATRVHDLEEASTALRNLLSSTVHVADPSQPDQAEASLEVTSLASVASLLGFNQPDNEHLDLARAYDQIIARWLEPLSPRIPGRVRLAKEQLARRVAADVCFASHALRQRAPVLQEAATQAASAVPDTHTGTFSVQDSGYTDVSMPPPRFSPFAPSQSSLPTPSPTATPSLASGSLSSHPSTLVPTEYTRLQRYTTFSNEKAAPVALPKTLSNTLAHWSVGADPSAYDWISTQRRQELDAEYEDQDLTAKERARLQRRAERHLKRQRRETAAAQAQGAASSQAPQLISASQPAVVERRSAGFSQPLVVLGESQLATQPSSQVGAFPASQVEAGRFGGRAPARKKRRTQGF